MATGRFDSIEEFVAQAFNPVRNRDAVMRFAQENRGDWYGTGERSSRADDVRRLISGGWSSGAERIARFAAGLEVPVIASVRRRGVWTDYGDSVDMQRVYAGQLDTAWRRTIRTNYQQPPRVCIAADCIAQGGKRAEDMFWQGAAVAALADVLTQAGYSVQCISGFRGTYGAELNDVQVIVKDYAAPWSLADAASSLALPGFFRAIGHMWSLGHCNQSRGNVGMNVCTLSLSHIDAPEAKKVFLAPQALSNEHAAKAWILSVLKDMEGDAHGTHEH